MNEVLLDVCQNLKEYMLFTTKIRENQKTMNLRDAVNRAVEDCIAEGILAEFFTAQRAEVVAMSIFEYDAEKHIRQEKEESYEDGYNAGRTMGKMQGKAEGKAESVLIILKNKGTVSEEISNRILAEKDNNVMDRWLVMALDCESVEAFERGMRIV